MILLNYAIDGVKIGDFANLKQINIFGIEGKFYRGLGPAIANEVAGVSFTEAYQDMLSDIKDFGKHIKFYGLVIPRKAVVDVKLLEFETVTARYIKDYLHMTDQIAERWDILVGSV